MKIRFRIDRNAAVTFFFDKKVPGRVKGGKCRKPVPGKKGGKKCVRFVYSGRFTKANLPSGANVVIFKGKVGKKKLTPGNYRIRLRAADLAGNSKDLPLSLKVSRR